MGSIAGVGSVALGIFLVILIVCWIILPFALIGTKPLLRQLIAETKRTNALLEGARKEPQAALPRAQSHERPSAATARFTGSPDLPPT